MGFLWCCLWQYCFSERNITALRDAVSGAVIFSAFGIFQGGGDPSSCLGDHPGKGRKPGDPLYGRADGDPPSCSGAGRDQQSQHGCDHPGDRSHPDLCIQSQISAFCGDRRCGDPVYRRIPGMASYRLERLAIWRNPEAYEKGFQTIQGLYAIGSGGIFGKGLGSSLQKLGFVPEAQNDMIFSIICEETGLTGACLVILLFGLLIWRLMVTATHAPDLCGSLIAAGIMAHMAIQVILNIAVVTNTIPNTGITLPFISYGGTSVLFLLGEMGIALSVSRQIKI